MTMRFRGRRPRTGRFTRPEPTDPPSNPPLDDPVLHTPPQDDVILDAGPSSGQTSRHSQDTAAELPVLGAGKESQADTSGNLTIIPDPPDRVEFACPCGAPLVATRKLYDRRSRCGACQAVLLLNLVYKRDLGTFEIEPFRVETDSGS